MLNSNTRKQKGTHYILQALLYIQMTSFVSLGDTTLQARGIQLLYEQVQILKLKLQEGLSINLLSLIFLDFFYVERGKIHAFTASKLSGQHIRKLKMDNQLSSIIFVTLMTKIVHFLTVY